MKNPRLTEENMNALLIALALQGGATAPAPSDKFPTAPILSGTEWLNTKDAEVAAKYKGRITLVHFWAFACGNCKNNLPAIQRLTEKFAKQGVVTIGIHTPEIEIEKKVENVQKAIDKHKITYPVLVDGDYKMWKAFGTQWWPTLYIIDQNGKARWYAAGELNYGERKGEVEAEKVIESLLKRKGA